MRHRSIFPYLVLIFGIMMLAGHFSHKPATGKQSAQDPRSGLSITDPGSFTDFVSVTDTLLSTRFHLKTYLVNTGEAPGVKLKYDPRNTVVERTPVFDTIMEFRYQDRVLFSEVSLKNLVSTSEKDSEFWNRSGLVFFEVDMINSTDERMVCRFSFRNPVVEKSRDFTLHIDSRGNTRIFEA
ncbi:hypothetical protein [Robertkochia flava]|uniref:hypothetical protein n=1 Tax=Robertkochia flava TaxID=3447986 RepID=UPI001CC9EB04|nr:hypothetical protein [Robertkochia marina]